MKYNFIFYLLLVFLCASCYTEPKNTLDGVSIEEKAYANSLSKDTVLMALHEEFKSTLYVYSKEGVIIYKLKAIEQDYVPIHILFIVVLLLSWIVLFIHIMFKH